jgi:hypothetical protein
MQRAQCGVSCLEMNIGGLEQILLSSKRQTPQLHTLK